MNIAIIEYKSDIDEALNYFPPENSLYLSVSAEASYCLSKRKIKFVTDESVLTPAEFKAIGDENFEITEKWIEELEAALQSENPLFKKRQFYPFKWHFYHLKILLDAVRIRKKLMEKLIERENPSLIGAPPPAIAGKIHDRQLFFHKYDSLYGILAQRIVAGMALEKRTWKKTKSNMAKPLIFEKIKDCLKSLIKKCIRTISASKDFFKRPQKKDNILVGYLYYDIMPLMRRLSHKFNFYYYENPLRISHLKSFLKLKSKEKDCELPKINFKNIFKSVNATKDPVIDGILGDRIQNYAERFIPPLWKGLNYLEALDDQLNFKAYIHHAGASDSFYGLPVYYFSRKKKPVFIIQHGSYGFALNRHTEYCEFGHDGYFFGWGDGISRMYDGRKKGDCKIISTGSSLIEDIKKKKASPRKAISRICYVPNSCRGYVAYYPNGQSCLDSELFIVETNFLLALKPYLKKYRITYKVYPAPIRISPLLGKNLMPDWIKENVPEMKIESRPLSSVIDKFDLFIIDWPSTTLVQACATGAEVIVYTGNKYQIVTAEAMELLKQRAVVVEKKEDFENNLKKVLGRGAVVSDTENTAFLEQYGIYRNDGKSLERMTTCIENILEKEKVILYGR